MSRRRMRRGHSGRDFSPTTPGCGLRSSPSSSLLRDVGSLPSGQHASGSTFEAIETARGPQIQGGEAGAFFTAAPWGRQPPLATGSVKTLQSASRSSPVSSSAATPTLLSTGALTGFRSGRTLWQQSHYERAIEASQATVVQTWRAALLLRLGIGDLRVRLVGKRARLVVEQIGFGEVPANAPPIQSILKDWSKVRESAGVIKGSESL